VQGPAAADLLEVDLTEVLTVVPEALKVSVWLVTFLTVRLAVIRPGMVGAFTDGRLRSIRFSESVAAAA
jgi:hypothetical protein